MRRELLPLLTLLVLLLAGNTSRADSSTTASMPVTHALSSRYQKSDAKHPQPVTVTQTKYKDAAGRTVSTAETKGNFTTHRDLSGRIVGYSLTANGKTFQYDARGRAIR